VAGDTSLWKCCNSDTMAEVVDWAGCLLIPLLATLTLHRDAGRIANLDPNGARPGSIRSVYPLGDDALGAKPTSMIENSRAIFGDVFVEQDASVGVAQQPCRGVLAVE
jgi:hypothetical protein